MSAPRVPRSLAQATALASRYAAVDGQLALVEAARAREIGKANADADVEAGPLVAQLEAIEAAMAPWWADNAAGLTKGKRKSAELGGCMLGSRAARAKLEHGFASDDEATAALAGSRWRKLTIVTKDSIDKAATLKLIEAGGKTADGLTALGFKASAGDDAFFIKRVEQSGTIGS